LSEEIEEAPLDSDNDLNVVDICLLGDSWKDLFRFLECEGA